ncbi:ANKHD1 [Symbiodinium necroappetens]|uniref:ANKHD1 protein n=1 Tax=Symbiodinium necroappetens TaxID=1628268 RepID=A0A813BVZ0_9DINO|nr:ANKHD1 [Symbiodinium necroappetens]
MGSSVACLGRLIDARADLNEQYEPSAADPLGLVMKLKGLQYQISKVPTILSTVGYHHYGSTPLMVGIMCGNFETAVALIMKKARLDLKNVRNKTALDLAHELQAPDYLVNALREPASLETRLPVGQPMQPNDSQESLQEHYLCSCLLDAGSGDSAGELPLFPSFSADISRVLFPSGVASLLFDSRVLQPENIPVDSGDRVSLSIATG